MKSVCAKCGSSKIIPDAQVFDQGQYSDGYVKVMVPEEPEALIFKGNKLTPLRARVCGDCGFTELAVEDPQLLWEAYVKSHPDFLG
jgi:ribosomal protein S27AE